MRVATHFRLVVLVLSTTAGLPAAQGNDPPLNAEEIRALMARVISNQHRNDEALVLCERREHRVSRKSEAESKAPDEDKLFRVVPTGTGTLKLILEERGQPVTPENYRAQLRELEKALAWALDPAESKQKQRVQKWGRRSKERFDTVEAVREAFVCTWAGREERNGVALIKLTCAPNLAFKPGTRTEEMFQHARAALWIEPRSAQIARVEADLSSDLSIGGGVLGKIYHGGRFVMEQAAVAEGVWLPTLFQYDFRGRRFVFGFELHEVTTASNYRKIGPPAEALAAVRAEIGAAGNASPAPRN